ncbi:hypothetical protein KC19_11G031600 [Ceratodon purpureus]|uniref:Uncharacterized protein n=1 Tax=Ceratodon purpureus TaxID=3225 RepID=A0A8T0GCD2_CERPU|nr:hypothetical protein KC19_11G031600 [Ceratodon purpureus]
MWPQKYSHKDLHFNLRVVLYQQQNQYHLSLDCSTSSQHTPSKLHFLPRMKIIMCHRYPLDHGNLHSGHRLLVPENQMSSVRAPCPAENSCQHLLQLHLNPDTVGITLRLRNAAHEGSRTRV